MSKKKGKGFVRKDDKYKDTVYLQYLPKPPYTEEMIGEVIVNDSEFDNLAKKSQQDLLIISSRLVGQILDCVYKTKQQALNECSQEFKPFFTRWLELVDKNIEIPVAHFVDMAEGKYFTMFFTLKINEPHEIDRSKVIQACRELNIDTFF